MFWWEQPERSAELIREHALAAGLSLRPLADVRRSRPGRACPSTLKT